MHLIRIYSQKRFSREGERRKKFKLNEIQSINEKLLTWSGLLGLRRRWRFENGMQMGFAALAISRRREKRVMPATPQSFWAVPWEYIRRSYGSANKQAFARDRQLLLPTAVLSIKPTQDAVEGLNCSLARSISMLSKLSKSCYFATFQEKLRLDDLEGAIEDSEQQGIANKASKTETGRAVLQGMLKPLNWFRMWPIQEM